MTCHPSPGCEIPNPSLVAMCQGEKCLNVGANRHFVYETHLDKYGVRNESRRLYCGKCCPVCRGKEKSA